MSTSSAPPLLPPRLRHPGSISGSSGIRGLFLIYVQASRRMSRTPRVRHSFLRWIAAGGLAEALVVGWFLFLAHGALIPLAVAGGALWWAVVSLVFYGGAALLKPPGSLRRIPYYGLPNGVTLLRAYLAWPVFLIVILPLSSHLAFDLWCGFGGPVACLDAVDGWLARHHGPITQLGAAVDPLTDVLFFSIAAFGSWRLSIMPGWFAILIAVRFVGPLIATPVVLMARRRPELTHTGWGRANTVLTGSMLVVLAVARSVNGPTTRLSLVLGAPLVGGTTLLHFVSLGHRTYLSPTVRERKMRRLKRRRQSPNDPPTP